MSNRHPDFEYILGEFKRYYKDPAKAMDEYKAWLNALKLNDSKSYGQSRESFQWARDMISRFKEDAANVYYKVLVGFPTKSMNRNVYKERDLVAAAHTLVGKHPSINHKDEYRLSPDNPHNRWGIVTVVAAAPEDGAVEAVLQVPKTALCPVCNGAKLTELIDNRRIYNVSLEGECMGNDHGVCDGFQFTENGFSLLTSDVLPGIPMSKIYPMESFLAFLPAKPSGKRSIIIKGLKTTSEGTVPMSSDGNVNALAGMGGPNSPANTEVIAADSKGQCPAGYTYSATVMGCVPISEVSPRLGFDQTKGGNKANSDLRRPRAETGRPQFMPEGTKIVLDQGGSSQKYHTARPWNETDARMNDAIPNRAMGNPKGCEQSDLGVESEPMPDGQGGKGTLPDRSPSDQPAAGVDARSARTVKTERRDECRTAGDMGKLQGQTRTILDASNADRFHPDNDDRWLIERGGIASGDAETAMKKGAPENTNILDRPNPTTKNDNQPAYFGIDRCPPGMRWDGRTGMCTFSSPANESEFNPNGPCSKGEVYDAHDGKCVKVEGPNILDEPDSATKQMGHPPVPPIDQPTSPGVVYKQCPPGYVFDPDTGMCGFIAAQTETIKTGDVRGLSNMDKNRQYNPSSPTSDVRHGQPADARGAASCRDGMVWDSRKGMCVVASDQNEATVGPTDILDAPKISPYVSNNPASDQCTDGLVWNARLGMCVPTDDSGSTGDKSNVANTLEAGQGKGPCPPGMKMDLETGVCSAISDIENECKMAGTMGDLQGQTRTILDAGGNDKYHPDNDDKWLIEDRRRRLEEPFAGYKNFADCMSKNAGKKDPAAYCGSIKAQAENHSVNHELELSQALSRAAQLEATLSQERIRFDAELKGQKALVAKHWNAYQLEKDVRIGLEGRLKELARSVDAHEDRTRAANSERVDLEAKLARRERDLTEALEGGRNFKEQLEALRTEHEQTEAKYREALKMNLALNKQITKQNEDYLNLAKEKEATEEAFKKTQRLAKHIFKVKT